MSAETILLTLLRINVVASVAILLVLLLRSLVLRRFGASVTYWLWLVVPIAMAASTLPARERIVPIPAPGVMAMPEEDSAVVAAPAQPSEALAARAVTPFVSLSALADLLVAIWLLAAGALLARSVVHTRRLAADPTAGPALVGVFRPKLLLPADFETRFDAEERALILAHEDIHRVSGHTVVNALVEVARCASWFNPLAHLAAIRIRTDQELACDAAVIAARPTARRAYAEALLKTQSVPALMPLGCAWTSRSGKRFGQRIALLGRAPLSRHGAVAGAAAVAVAGLTLGYAAWAQQPERQVTRTAGADTRPAAVWTPSADAPEGLLTPLERDRHDRFIERAQAGGIDIVLFGTTSTEMWHWQARGLSVWDQAFGSEQAANFGSQGTRFESLLWRMQNGELDGYQSKLVVLQAWGPTDSAIPVDQRADFIANYAALIAEIRARQPQARIVIFADFPRGGLRREQWRQAAEANAAVLANLVDDETVFYADIGERFFRPDGSHNGEMWRRGSGIQKPAFEAWAEELQPWLDRFVR